MRARTTVALGLLLVAAACGSDESSSTLPPSFTGDLPGQGSDSDTSQQGPDDDSATNSLQPNVGTADEPNNPANGEGIDDDIELSPNEPSGEATSGDATNDDGPSTEPDPAQEPDAVDEPDPPAEEPDPVEEPPVVEARTQVFLLFGQSNMYGTPPPDQQDLAATPRAEVLTIQGCQAHGQNQFVPAQPPLHGCVGQPSFGAFGPGLGPGDYFAKEVTAAFPEDTVILIPNAIAGVPISTFAPGQQAYNSIVSRGRMAQERGEIAGILFHQGEADSGNPNGWVNAVAQVVSSLKSDLGLDDNVPFIAGELPYDGCCGGHNNFVNQLPGSIPNAHVVSAQGLGTYVESQGDFAGSRLHFDTNAQREFGRRYAQTFLDAIGR